MYLIQDKNGKLALAHKEEVSNLKFIDTIVSKESLIIGESVTDAPKESLEITYTRLNTEIIEVVSKLYGAELSTSNYNLSEYRKLKAIAEGLKARGFIYKELDHYYFLKLSNHFEVLQLTHMITSTFPLTLIEQLLITNLPKRRDYSKLYDLSERDYILAVNDEDKMKEYGFTKIAGYYCRREYDNRIRVEVYDDTLRNNSKSFSISNLFELKGILEIW